MKLKLFLIQLSNVFFRILKINSPTTNNKSMLLAVLSLISLTLLLMLYINIDILYEEFYTIKVDIISSLNPSYNFLLDLSYVFNICFNILKIMGIFPYRELILYKVVYSNLIIFLWILILFFICLFSNFITKHKNHFIFKSRFKKKKEKKFQSILENYNTFMDNIFFYRKKILGCMLVFLSFWIIFSIALRFSFNIWLISLGFVNSFIPYITLSLCMPFLCYFYNIIFQFITKKQIKNKDLYFFNKKVVNNINFITLTLSNIMLYLFREYNIIYYTSFLFLFLVIPVLLYIYIRYYFPYQRSTFYNCLHLQATGSSISTYLLGSVLLLGIEIDISNLPTNYSPRLENLEQRALEWTEVQKEYINQRMINKESEVSRYRKNMTYNPSIRLSSSNYDKLKYSSILKLSTKINDNDLINKMNISVESNELIVWNNTVACQGKFGNNMLLYILTKGGYTGDCVLPSYVWRGYIAKCLYNVYNICDVKFYPGDIRGIDSILFFTPAEWILIENNTFLSRNLCLLPRPCIYYTDMIRFKEKDDYSLESLFHSQIEGLDVFDKNIENYRISVLDLLKQGHIFNELKTMEINNNKIDIIKSYINEAFGVLGLLSSISDPIKGNGYLYIQNDQKFLGVYDAPLKLKDYVNLDKTKVHRTHMLKYFFDLKDYRPRYFLNGIDFVYIDGVYVEILHAKNWTDKLTVNLSTYIDPDNKYEVEGVNTGSSTLRPLMFKQQYNLLDDKDRKSIKKILIHLSNIQAQYN